MEQEREQTDLQEGEIPILALRILRFEDDFEINEKLNAWRAGGKFKKKAGGLDYLRYPVEGLTRSESSQRLQSLAGPEKLAMVEGIYFRLTSIAADKRREYRGWLVDSDLCPLGPGEIANFTGYPESQIAEAIDILRLARLAEWLPCPFARKSVDIIRLAAAGTTTAEFPEIPGNSGNPLKNQNQIQESKTLKPEPEQNGVSVPIEDGKITGDLRGLPAVVPEESESGDLGSEDLESERILNSDSADPESGDLPRDDGRQSVNDTDDSDGSRKDAPGNEAKKNQRYEPGASGALTWDLRIAEMNVEKDDPEILIEGLSDNDRYAREQLIERAMIWLKMLLPAMDPPNTAMQEVLQEARGSQTTFENLLLDLWKKEKADGILWMIRTSQKKRREFHRSRGRIKNLRGLIVAETNKKLGKTTKRQPATPIRGP